MNSGSFRKSLVFRFITVAVMVAFVGLLPVQPSFAQFTFMPEAGTMIPMTSHFDPMMVRGMRLYTDNPFKFDFIVDTGDQELSRDDISRQGQKLASYFFASLTTPEKEMWVNLSPYEHSRIIPRVFGDTEMGRELLSEDYILKQLMASTLYPEHHLGQEFWQSVYTQAERQFGTTNVSINTFNKVWIVPDQAVVYENAKLNSVFVVRSHLKVMLEQDYLAANKHKAVEQFGMTEESLQKKINGDAVSTMASKIIKQIVVPALEREVNEGKNFAGLRQVYQSLILAAWYKNNLRDNVLSQGYVNRHKILGVDNEDKQITEEIYQQYLRAYRKGVYNYIKEDVDPVTNNIIPRKYFSGGFEALGLQTMLQQSAMSASPQEIGHISADISNSAMLGRILIVGVTAVALAGWTSASASAAGEYGSFLAQVKQNAVTVTHPDGQAEPVTMQNFGVVSQSLKPGDIVVNKMNGSSHEVNEGDKSIGISGIIADMNNRNNGAPPVVAQDHVAIPPVVEQRIVVPSKKRVGAVTPGFTPLPIAGAPQALRVAANPNPAKYGGIDLEKLFLNTRGSGVHTAFSDPGMLQILLESKGLFPQVRSVETVTLPMVNMLLGLNTSVPADDNGNAPGQQASNKPSYLSTAMIDPRDVLKA